jgi:ABC-type phosphate transport system substrate-binding protein
LNNIQKSLLSGLVIALFAFSFAATIVHATTLPFQNGQLVAANTLNVAGSSTVGPIALEEATQFPAYWNSLVSSNPSWGTSSALDISTVNVAELGSGTAIPALTGGTADIGEMSRPPQASSSEWGAPAMTSMQIWAIGIDSIAIVVSPDMTWFPTNLNTAQVAALFAETNPTDNQNQQTSGVTGTTPIYTTWGQFLTDNGFSTAGVSAAALSENIVRAVRDPTSGTFDCFNNYFVIPNGYGYLSSSGKTNGFEYKNSGGTVVGSQNMAPYIYCQENINVYDTVSAGNTAAGTDAIGFISLGYYQTYGNMIGLDISYNMANPPTSLIAYPGTAGDVNLGTPGSTLPSGLSGYTWATSGTATGYSWGSYITPTRANVIYAYSGIQGTGATGKYEAWRYLWEVTPSAIPATGPLLATGVWIAYMRAYGTTSSGTSDFVNDNNYIQMNLADYTGAQDLNSNLQPYTPLPGQTQQIPNGQVGSADFFYFVNAYIAYYTGNTYNPYADILANGHVNSADFFAFVNQYIAYFTTYNPT